MQKPQLSAVQEPNFCLFPFRYHKFAVRTNILYEFNRKCNSLSRVVIKTSNKQFTLGRYLLDVSARIVRKIFCMCEQFESFRHLL